MDNLISQKLNVFIRKYYKNKVLRSVINALSVMSVGFAVFCIIEYFGWNSVNVRTFIFYLYIGIAVVMAAIIVFPLFKMFRIGKTLSYRQAAEIIGRHFPQIQDKLLNLLQLQQMSENSQSELLIKAIEQKTEQLSPIPFHKAVNTEKTKKWGKYLLITVGVIGLTAVIFPDLFSQSGKRYINHNTFYEKPAPFAFTLVSPTQTAELNDYTVEAKVSGKMLPEKVNVIINGKTFEMTKKSKSSFVYTITQIQKNTSLQFEAAGVLSRIYNTDVIPKPVLTSIQAEIIYPAYTGIQNETLTDISGLSVPKGTKINWTLKGKDCSYITVASYYGEDKKHSDIKRYTPDKKGSVAVSKTYMHSEIVSIRTANARTASSDSIAFVINTVDDEKPSIAVIEQKDSLIADNIFFRGQIKDDYGFSKLEFCMKVTSANGKQTKDYVERLQITDKENVQEFYHAVSLKKYNIAKGDKAEYFFRVWDNDALGAKSSVCQTFTLEVPTESQIEEKLQNNSSEIKQQTDKTLDEIKKLQKEIEELTKILTEKNNLSWQDEKDIQALQQKQQSIQEKISEINKKIQQNAAIENNYNTVDPELLEKQRQIEELFSQLQNNELEKLMQQLKEMIDKNANKDKINENLKNLNLKNEELSKELDKNLELYKRLEVEKDIINAIVKLNKFAEKQEKLAEQTGKKHTPLS
ncbi:MAG: hypothetical protein IJ250_00490, partial [Bacteroidales bacterium]|nr:hypothetical protein [Bacteroidales bacterium]